MGIRECSKGIQVSFELVFSTEVAVKDIPRNTFAISALLSCDFLSKVIEVVPNTFAALYCGCLHISIYWLLLIPIFSRMF